MFEEHATDNEGPKRVIDRDGNNGSKSVLFVIAKIVFVRAELNAREGSPGHVGL